MTDRIAIFSYGAVGRAMAARLIAEGRQVIVAQRRAPRGIGPRARRSPPTRPTTVGATRNPTPPHKARCANGVRRTLKPRG